MIKKFGTNSNELEGMEKIEVSVTLVRNEIYIVSIRKPFFVVVYCFR